MVLFPHLERLLTSSTNQLLIHGIGLESHLGDWDKRQCWRLYWQHKVLDTKQSDDAPATHSIEYKVFVSPSACRLQRCVCPSCCCWPVAVCSSPESSGSGWQHMHTALRSWQKTNTNIMSFLSPCATERPAAPTSVSGDIRYTVGQWHIINSRGQCSPPHLLGRFLSYFLWVHLWNEPNFPVSQHKAVLVRTDHHLLCFPKGTYPKSLMFSHEMKTRNVGTGR